MAYHIKRSSKGTSLRVTADKNTRRSTEQSNTVTTPPVYLLGSNFQLVSAMPQPGNVLPARDTTSEASSVLNDKIPRNFGNSIEVLAPKSYQPRDVYDILTAPYYYPKWQLYCTMDVFLPRLLKNANYIKECIRGKIFQLKPYEELTNEKLKDTSKDNAGVREAMIKYDLIRRAVDNMSGDPVRNINTFSQMIADIVDAYCKGISLQEIHYELKNNDILPWGTSYINAFFYNPQAVDSTLYLIDGSIPNPDKFIASLYRNRSTTNITSFGCYQSLAWLFSVYVRVMDYWGQSIQKFGMPFRTLTYPAGSSEQFKQELADVMELFGSSGWSVFPEGCKFDVIQSAIVGKENPHRDFIDYINTNVDIVMLGQNLTTETNPKTGGGSYNLGKIHENKETQVIDNITEFILEVLNNQFVPAILSVNGMDEENKPFFSVSVDKDIDTFLRKLDAVQKLINMGFTVDTDSIRAEAKEYGIELDKIETVPTPNQQNDQPKQADEENANNS